MLIGLTKISLTKTSFNYPSVKELPLRLPPLKCTQAHSHHEQNKIQTVTVSLTQCDCLYPCPFHITFFIPCSRPSVSSTGDTQKGWEGQTSFYRERGEGGWALSNEQLSIRQQESLVLYMTLKTFWDGVSQPHGRIRTVCKLSFIVKTRWSWTCYSGVVQIARNLVHIVA